MKVKDGTVYFKSEEAMYLKEQTGRKCNTVRVLSEIERNIVMWNNIDTIHIDCLGSMARFDRDLTDISFVGKLLGVYIAVFSWHNGGAI